MNYKDQNYEIIAHQGNYYLIKDVRTGEELTITEEQGEVIFDFHRQQYNSNRRYRRHQDKFFHNKSIDPETSAIDALGDRSSMEVTAILNDDQILIDLIEREDKEKRNSLIKQIPNALAQLTEKQRDAITRHYLNGIKQKQIAEEDGVSEMAISKRIKGGISQLKNYFQKNSEKEV